MTERQLKLLYDIKMAIDEIDSYFKTEDKTYENYRTNSGLLRKWEYFGIRLIIKVIS